MKLTYTERWMLANQYRILEVLYPHEADSFAEAREALEQGYEGEYSSLAQHIYDGDDVMTEAECTEVSDILRMFSQITYSLEQLDGTIDGDRSTLNFLGFDGNNESKQLGYARYLIGSEPDRRYPELSARDNFNSHMPVIDAYRRQLVAWRPHQNKRYLSKEALEQIAAAAYPASR